MEVAVFGGFSVQPIGDGSRIIIGQAAALSWIR